MAAIQASKKWICNSFAIPEGQKFDEYAAHHITLAVAVLSHA